ncbi:MAG: tRNA pseudouridine(55) synthase TruB [Sphingobacteriales bacterium]|nr:MAG: tRNA pseudouridine(55) synthase TruB [Sphingobacteriales bacterium]
MDQPKTYDFEAGEVLLIDKPLTWTSFDVVNKLRYALKVKKIGHAGTLDPLATGLLILCTGKFTKRIEEIQNADKEYTGRIFLGATTPSFDSETEHDQIFDIIHLTPELIHETAKKFIGEQQQIPPLYSAVHINGKRAYTLARKGIEAEIPPRTVTISEFEITKIELPEVHFRVAVSKGTYIRSLARDFGKALGAGGYLTELVRTRIGNYYLHDAVSLENMLTIAKDYRAQKEQQQQQQQ